MNLLARTASARLATAPRGLSPLARELLALCVGHIELRLDDGRPDVVSSALASAGGALEAFRGVGLISHEELTEWFARFWEAITGEPLPNVPRQEQGIQTATSVGPTVTAVAVPVAGVEVPLPQTPRFQSIGFRRLLPGPDEEKALGPGVLRILALVVYGDGVEVDWLFSLPPNADTFAAERDAVAGELDELPPDEQVRRLQIRDHHLRWAAAPHDFALSDDVGTVYEWQGGGSGGFVTMRGQHAFTPTLAPEARRVYIDADGVRLTVTVA